MVASNAKNAEKSSVDSDNICPAIAYFVAYRETETCSENALFAAIHNEDTTPVIRAINTRTSQNTEDETMQKAAKQLFQVLRDHNNPAVLEMLDRSNTYCYAECTRQTSDEDDEEDEPSSQPTHFPTTPCRLVVINQVEFNDQLHQAAATLQSDGLLVELDSKTNVSLEKPCFSSTSEVAATVKKIERMMKLCDHALYRRDVYAKPADADVTYLKMMDVTSYLHKLLSNDAIRDQVG